MQQTQDSTGQLGYGITRERAYEKSWKYIGYKVFTRYVSSDANFFFVRRYRILNARVILAMQDHILELEDKLNELDNNLSHETATDDVHNGSYRQETSRDRLELIWEVQRRLKDYNDYINSYSQIAAQPRVLARDVNSVRTWIDTWPNAIDGKELSYIDQGDDLTYVVRKPETSVNRRFKDFVILGRPWFRRPHEVDIENPEMHYAMRNVSLYEDRRAESFLKGAAMLIGLAMLICPLWILEFLSGSLQRLGTITAFILLFFMILSVATTARPSECLAATAGYSAVLMVFLQIHPLGSES